MLQREIDLTAAFNTNPTQKIDVSGWDYVLAQIQTPSATIYFNGTNDAGGVVGVTDGNASLSLNYQPVEGQNTGNNQYVTSTGGNGIFKFNVVSRFLEFTAAPNTTVSRLIISLTKIS
jgi:hypothetical protein